MQPDKTGPYFALFNEVGIIEQLGRALLEARLPKGLITPHFTVLNHLTRVADGRTPLDLAHAFQVPKTSMTHTLAGLEKAGLVRIAPNPDDKRSKRVWLSDEGRALRARVIAAMAPEFDSLSQEFPPEMVARIVPILAELRAILDRRRDTPSPSGES